MKRCSCLCGASQPAVSAPTRTEILRELLHLDGDAFSQSQRQHELLSTTEPDSTRVDLVSGSSGQASHGTDLRVNERHGQPPVPCIASHDCRSPRH